MGEQRVSLVTEDEQMHRFVKSLLKDVQALEYMLENECFEDDIVRIGAEQEMCLVNNVDFKPACIITEVLERLGGHDWVETELAKFNLEIGLDPRKFEGDCLSAMEKEILSKLGIIKSSIKDLDAKVLLCGILPTLRKFDLRMDNLTPKKRYHALMNAINMQLEATAYELRISGIDDLLIKHDSPLLEAVNTSFQIHLQVAPRDFAKMYNISQTLAAPVIAVAANSPIVFGKRLWHESRIAMFQQSLDTRTTKEYMRERSPRVSFGKDWVDSSILEIYREDITRFRVLLSSDVEEDSIKMIRNNEVPKLRALQVHNSTVYRWNRPCYGVSPNGKPHLRIECRVLPAGPTVVDEMANAAFWLGTMKGMEGLYTDIREEISFEDIRDNFGKAAQFGIDSKFTWLKDKKISAIDLLTKELIPISREGLKTMQVDGNDIDRYLDIIEERAKKHMNGARWSLRAYTKLIKDTNMDEAVTTMTASISEYQEQEIPVHKWDLPKVGDLMNYNPSDLSVEEFMITDLFTVYKDDIIDLVADMMDWRKIRYTPVENKAGELVGLVTSRILLRHFIRRSCENTIEESPVLVKDVMITDPITVSPSTNLMEAINIMREKQIGCLPVVNGKELIGIITVMDFLRITTRLIDRMKNKKR
jgi:CBS domain-containing protein/gamma-glutamylcysteine synthetase